MTKFVYLKSGLNPNNLNVLDNNISHDEDYDQSTVQNKAELIAPLVKSLIPHMRYYIQS